MLLPPDVSPATLALLFIVAVIGGTVDAIAGGGGLLTLPALLSAGLPAPFALATKVMNFSSNVASLAVFIASGLVAWLPGLVMASGQVIGGRPGAHLAMTRGARFVRPIFLAMAGLIVAKMIYSNYLCK